MGETASKGVAVAHGLGKQPVQYHSEKNIPLMGDIEDDEVKNWYKSPLLEGTNKSMAVEGDYICFTVVPFNLWVIYMAPFHHIIISLCEYGCVFCAKFHHICFTIDLY